MSACFLGLSALGNDENVTRIIARSPNRHRRVDGDRGPRTPLDECAIATTKAGRRTLASRRLCLITAVLSSTWLIAPLLDPQLHPWTSYASAYLVSGRPAATLLRTTDGLSGVLLVVISALYYARLRIVWRGLRLDHDAAAAVGHVSTRRRERVAVRTWCAATMRAASIRRAGPPPGVRFVLGLPC